MMPSLEVSLKSLVAAYSVIFGGVFVFIWLMFGRQKKLEKRLEQIREDLKDAARSASK